MRHKALRRKRDRYISIVICPGLSPEADIGVSASAVVQSAAESSDSAPKGSKSFHQQLSQDFVEDPVTIDVFFLSSVTHYNENFTKCCPFIST